MASWPSARDASGALRYAQLDDDVLVNLLARRDPAALETLYDRHSRLAYSVALRVLIDQHRAEDVVQEAYVKLWRQPDLFDSERGRFQPWFLQLVRHRAVDVLRSRSREHVRKSDDAGEDVWQTLPDPGPPPEDQVVATLDRESVVDALDQLPPEQREVIELAYFGGLAQSEIAAHLSVPLGTVKTRVRLGMKRLRDLLVRDL